MSAKYFQFSKGLLIGVTHNDKISTLFTTMALEWENEIRNKFDFYLIELNKDNYNFIEKNKFENSEFYPIISSVPRNKIVLLDIELKKEIGYEINSYPIDFVNYRLDKYLYYKMRNYLTKINRNHIEITFNNSALSDFHSKHILKREQHFITEISEYITKDNRLLIIVGLSHFEKIKGFLLEYL